MALQRFLVSAIWASVLIQFAPPSSSAQHIEVRARCDPPIVQPGGWVDVVVDVRTDPGWHITSPRSKGGQRASVVLELPEGFDLSGGLHAPPGRELHDEVFGTVEILEGSFELRQRVRVPGERAACELAIGGSSTWIVCDPARCLPPQRLEFSAQLKLDPLGARGPNPPIGESSLHLKPEEGAVLATEGFVARACPEVDRVSPGEDQFVVLDVAFDPAEFERVLEVWLEPAYDWQSLGEGWRARDGEVEWDSGRVCQALRHMLPLRVAVGCDRAQIDLSIRVRLRLAEPSASGSEAIREVRLTLPVER